MDKIETAEAEDQGTLGLSSLIRHALDCWGVFWAPEAGDAKHFFRCFGFVMHKPSSLEGVFFHSSSKYRDFHIFNRISGKGAPLTLRRLGSVSNSVRLWNTNYTEFHAVCETDLTARWTHRPRRGLHLWNPCSNESLTLGFLIIIIIDF